MSHIPNRGVTRRRVIAGLASLPLSARFAGGLLGADLGASPGLVMREREPLNLESDFSSLSSLVTQNDKFYVRSHFRVPELDANSWRLRVNGAMNKSLELSYDELTRLPSKTKVVTLECAGNGRVFLVPKVE